MWALVLVTALAVSMVGVTASIALPPRAAAIEQAPAGLSSPTHFGHPLISAATPSGSAGANGPYGCPLASAQCLGAYNWAGYVDYNASYLVSAVTGTWTLPAITGSNAVTCPDDQKTWDSNAVWIGIDGAFSNTVEQTGTSSDCFYGQTSYYAWYEFYPAGSVVSSMPIYPGNTITATVNYVGTNASGPLFTTSLTDVSTHTTFKSPATAVPGAQRVSAEWIDESPYYNGFLGLTHVSTVQFTSAAATINGITRSIGGWGSANVYWIIMVDYNFPYDTVLAYAKALPQALNFQGNSFDVEWLSSGP